MKKANFNDVLLRVIDEQLLQIFGEAGTTFIYNHLADHYSLKREKIPENIEVFVRALEDYLGSGAHIMENMILKSLHSRFKQKLKSKRGCNLLDCVTYLKEIPPPTHPPPPEKNC